MICTKALVKETKFFCTYQTRTAWILWWALCVLANSQFTSHPIRTINVFLTHVWHTFSVVFNFCSFKTLHVAAKTFIGVPTGSIFPSIGYSRQASLLSTNKSCSTFKINLAVFKDAWALHTMVSITTITEVHAKISNANSCVAIVSWKTFYAFRATRFTTNTWHPISNLSNMFRVLWISNTSWPLQTVLPCVTIFFRKTSFWPTKTINTFQWRRTFLVYWWICPCLNYTIFRWLLWTTARPRDIKTLAPTTYLIF